MARAKAKVLENDMMGRKPEAKVIINTNMHMVIKWEHDRTVERFHKGRILKAKQSEPSCASQKTSKKSVRFIMDTLDVGMTLDQKGK